MPQYEFTQRYRSSYGRGDQGDVVELDETKAADIERDSPGTLRAVEKAPSNRQVTGGRNRTAKGGDDE